MPIALLIIFLLGLALVLRLVFEEATASYILAVMSILISVFYDEVRELRGRAEKIFSIIRLPKRFSIPSWITGSFDFLDLTFLLAALIVLLPAFFATFDGALADMVAKKYIVFPGEGDGFDHLRRYAMGYLAMPSMLAALTLYGIYRGPREKKVGVLSLCLSALFGFVLAILLLATLRGRWAGVEGLERYLQEVGANLPSGAVYALFLFIVVLLLVISVALGVYTWMLIVIREKISQRLRGLSDHGSKR